MTAVSVGSVCTGYDGLGLALDAVLGETRRLWFADPAPAASSILGHRWPEVPNLGDITAVDWSAVERPDILTAGFPCQDVSCAGLRAGIAPGTRSGLWTHIARIIDTLKPRMVVIENVRGLLSASADRGMGPGDEDLEGRGKPALRAAGAVLGDLADIGYDARWTTLRASDVGGAHPRARVFILAEPADAEGHPWWLGHGDGGPTADPEGVRHGHPQPAGIGRVPATAVTGAAGAVGLLPTPMAADGERTSLTMARGNPSLIGALLPTPAARDWKSGRSNIMDRNARLPNEVITNLLPTPRAGDGTRGAEPLMNGRTARDTGPFLVDAIQLLPTPRATDGTKGGPNQRGSAGDLMLPSAVMLLPTPTVSQGRNATANRTAPKPTTNTDSWTLQDVAYADRFGRFAPAIARWADVLGRPAPEPTEPNRNGDPRLAPGFVEWLMGLPPGHVTGVPGLTRNQQLHALGNGVVPQQASAAIAHLLEVAP